MNNGQNQNNYNNMNTQNISYNNQIPQDNYMNNNVFNNGFNIGNDDDNKKTPASAYVILILSLIGLALLFFFLFPGFILVLVTCIISRINKKKGIPLSKLTYKISLFSVILGIILILLNYVVVPTIDTMTKKKAFAELAESYIYGVKNAISSRSLECSKDEVEWIGIYDVPSGEGNIYYFMINTANDASEDDTLTMEAQDNTDDLIGASGKSPFGDADVKGYVHWIKPSDAGAFKYYIRLSDTSKNGFSGLTFENNISSSRVTKDVEEVVKPKGTSGYKYYRCRFTSR